MEQVKEPIGRGHGRVLGYHTWTKYSTLEEVLEHEEGVSIVEKVNAQNRYKSGWKSRMAIDTRKGGE